MLNKTAFVTLIRSNLTQQGPGGSRLFLLAKIVLTINEVYIFYFLDPYTAFARTGFDDQERHLTFVITVFQVGKTQISCLQF